MTLFFKLLLDLICLYSVKWFQVLLFNSINSIQHKWVLSQVKWLNSFIWSTDGTLTASTTPGLRGPEHNANEGLVHIPQSYRSHHQMQFNVISKTFIGCCEWGGVLPFCRDIVSIFYNLSWLCVFGEEMDVCISQERYQKKKTALSKNSTSRVYCLRTKNIIGPDFSDEAWWLLLLRIFRTIDLIFIVIITTFRPICPSAFFRCFIRESTQYLELNLRGRLYQFC